MTGKKAPCNNWAYRVIGGENGVVFLGNGGCLVGRLGVLQWATRACVGKERGYYWVVKGLGHERDGLPAMEGLRQRGIALVKVLFEI